MVDGVAERRDATIAGRQPVALAVGRACQANDRLVEGDETRRAEESGIAVGVHGLFAGAGLRRGEEPSCGQCTDEGESDRKSGMSEASEKRVHPRMHRTSRPRNEAEFGRKPALRQRASNSPVYASTSSRNVPMAAR